MKNPFQLTDMSHINCLGLNDASRDYNCNMHALDADFDPYLTANKRKTLETRIITLTILNISVTILIYCSNDFLKFFRYMYLKDNSLFFYSLILVFILASQVILTTVRACKTPGSKES